MSETRTVVLDAPIKRGEKELKEVTLRRPKAGELRGLKLQDVQEGDVSSLQVLLPRITELTKMEVEELDLTDLNAIGTEIVLFFVPKAARVKL